MKTMMISGDYENKGEENGNFVGCVGLAVCCVCMCWMCDLREHAGVAHLPE